MKQAKKNTNGLIDITGMFDEETVFNIKSGYFEDNEVYEMLDDMFRMAFIHGVDLGYDAFRWDEKQRADITYLVVYLKDVVKVLSKSTTEDDTVFIAGEYIEKILTPMYELTVDGRISVLTDYVDELLFITTIEAAKQKDSALVSVDREEARKYNANCKILKSLLRGYNATWQKQNKQAA